MSPILLLLLSAQASPEHFEKQVRPLFAAKCQACHGAKMQMGGLNLATGAGVNGKAILDALAYTGKYKMPPAGKLPDEEIAAVREWVEAGAAWPNQAAVRVSGITEADRNHWAFRPLLRPPLPSRVHPVDHFIGSALATKSLKPSPRAGKLTLLRRATLDLTGLLPTLEEIRAFEADTSPNAFAKVVDRLLASPRYGERWGRHWLDVARYADSTGMDEDNLYPHAWRYRDYVIDSFNRDLPYDQFLREQIAGDLLPAATPAERARLLTATGFLAIGPRALAQQDRLQAVYDIVDEQIDTVSKSVLGLTLACARCHDHKFDPLLTSDYYAMAGIFASTTQFRNHGRPGSIAYMYYAPVDEAAHARYHLHRSRMVAKQLEMEDAWAEDLGRDAAPYRARVGKSLEAAWRVLHQGSSPADKHITAWVEFLRKADDKARTGYLKNFYAATADTIASVAKAYQSEYDEAAAKWDKDWEDWRLRMAREFLQERSLPSRPKPNLENPSFFDAVTFNGGPMDIPESPRVSYLRQEYQRLKDTLPPEPGLISAVAEGPAIDQRIFIRGQIANQGERVPKRFPLVLAGEQQPAITQGSGRRELADWLASPANPLTARVMVNRIWQWHFGDGLVRSPNNWGRTGEKPTHPELLDFLAQHFIDSGWSVKAMHRLILLSETWQRSTTGPREQDPTNRYLARFPRQRMSIEQLRDSLLQLDGSLDTTMGGTLLTDGEGKGQKADPEEILRRTVYLPVRRGSIPHLLNIFDFGDATTASEGRTRTNVAPQALFLLNSPFVLNRAENLAKQLLANPDATKRIEEAYLRILTRRPTATERDEALSYIATLERTQPPVTAWRSYLHALITSSEFLFIE
jgi:cytochrome c553